MLRRYNLFLSFWSIFVLPSLVVCSDSSTSIPRSNHLSATSSSLSTDYHRFPPWNPSPNIDANGFLLQQYKRVPGEWEKEVKVKKRHRVCSDTPCLVRQVPGDGNCLFHSISTCYAHAVNGTHLDLRQSLNLQWLYQNSHKLRQQAVDCLEQKRKLLFLQGHEYLKTQDLVEAAASQYGITGSEYCHLMRQDSYWGGGPEIVALCNVLQRPIHVYELFASQNNNNHKKEVGGFVLRRMACFGSPKFDRYPALHILSADSRFPDLQPGKQLALGNHFLALFPQEQPATLESKQKQRLRGGDVASSDMDNNEDQEDLEDEPHFPPSPRWWSRLSLLRNSHN